MKSLRLLQNITFIFCVAVLSGCMEQSKGQYSPSIVCGHITDNYGDTLKLRLDDKQDYYWLDTIHVGDTVNFVFTFWGYENDLISTEIRTDSIYTILDMPLSEDVRMAMLETSDTLHGQIDFKPGYSAVQLPVNYIAVRQGTPSMFLSVHSDSKFSPTEFEIRTPIKE